MLKKIITITMFITYALFAEKDNLENQELKTSDSTSKKAIGIGYSNGPLTDSLLNCQERGEPFFIKLKNGDSINISPKKSVHDDELKGKRSRTSIMREILQNIDSIRYAYNKRLREKPNLKGKVTVKWAINGYGKVIFATVVGSTLSDDYLEKMIVSKIKKWEFQKIDTLEDVTEVVYPFVLSR